MKKVQGKYILFIAAILLVIGILSGCGNQEETAKSDKEIYEEKISLGTATEADFLALAEVHKAEGNQAEQYRVLSQGHRLNPSESYMQRMSELIWEKDATDTNAAALLAMLEGYLKEDKLVEVKELFKGEAWNTCFAAEFVGAERKTIYEAEGQKAQVFSNFYETEVFYFPNTGELLYCKSNELGTEIFYSGYADGIYTGSFAYSLYDGEGNHLRKYEGTFQDNICVEELKVTYKGSIYTGKLDESGKTEAEQISKVTNAGGVVYAYAGNSYLYVEDTTQEEFQFNTTYLGVPTYVSW